MLSKCVSDVGPSALVYTEEIALKESQTCFNGTNRISCDSSAVMSFKEDQPFIHNHVQGILKAVSELHLE
jgi:hypothetical protein